MDDENTPALPLVSVILSLTVPGEEAPAVTARLHDALDSLLTQGIPYARASVELYADTEPEG